MVTSKWVSTITMAVALLSQAQAAWTVTLLGPNDSQAFAASEGRQAGYALVGNQHHAVAWTGSQGSMVDLNPSGTPESQVYAMFGNQQGGYTRRTSSEPYHAAF